MWFLPELYRRSQFEAETGEVSVCQQDESAAVYFLPCEGFYVRL